MRLIDANALREIVEDGLRNNPHKDGFSRLCHQKEYTHFLDVICKMPTITPPPNDPLTLEELREMDGEPVWMTIPGKSGGEWVIARNINLGDVCVFCPVGARREYGVDGSDTIGDYGKTWLAYRRKTKEGRQ